LSRFHTVELVDKLDGRACPGRQARCLVDRYRDAGVDVVVLGRLRRELLEYEVYATWMRGRAFDGALVVANVEAATLRRHIGDIARPIVQRGGLVDERPQAPPAPAPSSAATGATAATTPTAATGATAATAPASSAAPPARRPVLLATLFVGLILL